MLLQSCLHLLSNYQAGTGGQKSPFKHTERPNAHVEQLILNLWHILHFPSSPPCRIPKGLDHIPEQSLAMVSSPFCFPLSNTFSFPLLCSQAKILCTRLQPGANIVLSSYIKNIFLPNEALQFLVPCLPRYKRRQCVTQFTGRQRNRRGDEQGGTRSRGWTPRKQTHGVRGRREENSTLQDKQHLIRLKEVFFFYDATLKMVH